MNAEMLLAQVLQLEAIFAGLSSVDFSKAAKKMIREQTTFLMAASWAMYTPGVVDLHKVADGVRNAEILLNELYRRHPEKIAVANMRGFPMPLAEN